MAESVTSIGAASPSVLRKQKGRHTNGWTPLVYPAFALRIAEEETNPCFPLERNVLGAAVRELLILDKSVDSETLEISMDHAAKFRDGSAGPLYLSHLDPSRWQVVVPPKQPAKKSSGVGRKKRKSTRSRFNMPRKRKKVKKDLGKDRNGSPGIESGWVTVEEGSNDSQDTKMASAEALVDIIVERAYDISIDTPLATSEEARTIRKVSDADTDDNSFSTNLLGANDSIGGSGGSYGSNDISRFYDIENRSILSKETPHFLEVCIASEILLRDLAHRITLKLVESFDERTLRMFLGYKSSTLKRDRLITVLTEYFFDVSHAMFAWKQTERELASERGSSNDDGFDKEILDTLFDSRALRKIGGFDDSSLLPHALSICRLRETGVCWKTFAKSKRGRANLKHHRDGSILLVGQKRRGQRVRIRHNIVNASDCSETGTRSRSSSIASYDVPIESKERGDDIANGSIDIVVDSPPHEELWTEERQASLQMPDVLNVSLRKAASDSWGVLLSKEGSMCVVVRAPEQATGGLKIGDVILSVGKDTQASCNGNWFRTVVNIFKSSNELNLVVRRVGSGQQTPAVVSVSDDSSREESVTLN